MLIVNQAGTTIYNMGHNPEIFLAGNEIFVITYDDDETPIYKGKNAAAVFEAIIEAASTGAKVIRLDKEAE